MIFFKEGKKRQPRAGDEPLERGLPEHHREMLDALLTACRNTLRTVDADLITKAFLVAREAHEGQFRANGDEYLTHPHAVAMIATQEIPVDDVTVAAALLHDVIEGNEQFTYERIQAEFGSTIADIVDGATKIINVLQSREVTTAASYRKLLGSMLQDARVILVKFADRLHNMRTLEFVSEEKRKRIAHETLEIYAPLAHRLGLARLKCEFEDLSFKYLYPSEYEKVKEQIALRRREREEYIARFTKPIRLALARENLPAEVSGRPKHLWSIYRKMTEQQKSIDEIYDLFAVRIILDSDEEKDCYRAYATVCSVYTPIPERYKNFIALPKQNGYKSIHTTVLGPEGKMVEVQIRTRRMHEIAEKGIAAHWAYKEGKHRDESAFEHWAMWVRELLEAQTGSPAGEEGARELIDTFKSSLYQDEIAVFTPKGDVIVLPRGATPVDFAFAIHSEIGLHCIGAKVNGRIVPLNRSLRSGDRVEIITSRNQFISPDLEQSVVTGKARVGIRRFIDDRTKLQQQRGKEQWERKTRRLRRTVSDENLQHVASRLGFTSPAKMFVALGDGELSVEEILHVLDAPDAAQGEATRGKFTGNGSTQESPGPEEHAITVEGVTEAVPYDFARCCNPLPGDHVVAYVTPGSGIKIHRRSCRNIQRVLLDTGETGRTMRERIRDAAWVPTSSGEYLGGIRIEGIDRPGLLQEIALAVSSCDNTSIRSIRLETRPETGTFHGSILMSVHDLGHLERLIERVRGVQGVTIAERSMDVE
ncbi:MAG: bifunctional (p)ppGpp synthetase/guanosine-3',5'-bis(diphosphate) 3'-pyrophosphohydrolase [Bacteroidota bacterium]|nr:bifunctional (p)ppGpp synthetase/guanosine-3',5'-bis(diphosphate) 3'-pyrophosphohydrolase [Bacteroidota bacterium]